MIKPQRLHVTPVDDTVAHVLNDECVCGPRIELVLDQDGSDTPVTEVVIHHSLDGRELDEPI